MQNEFDLKSLPEQLSLVGELQVNRSNVYLTHRQGAGRFVLKAFPNTKTRLYENEIQVSSGLDHPNILTPVGKGLHKSEDQEDYHYILTNYHSHGTLFNMFATYRMILSEQLVRTFFHKLVSAIEYMHLNGKAHTDLKPANILIGEDFQPKIFDFDLSYTEGQEFLSLGSPCFRAPELAKKKSGVNPYMCDIYSLGVLLFLMNNGRLPPFQEDENGEFDVMRAHFDTRPDLFWSTMERKNRDVKFSWSSEFKELFEGLVQNNPKKRFSFEQIKKSAWYKGPVYDDDTLAKVMEKKYNPS